MHEKSRAPAPVKSCELCCQTCRGHVVRTAHHHSHNGYPNYSKVKDFRCIMTKYDEPPDGLWTKQWLKLLSGKTDDNEWMLMWNVLTKNCCHFRRLIYFSWTEYFYPGSNLGLASYKTFALWPVLWSITLCLAHWFMFLPVKPVAA